MVIACSFKESLQKNHLCEQPFALCTSAVCVPSPEDSEKAVCFCDVENGPSMGTKPCGDLKPSKDKNGITTLYSAYSLKQFEQGYKGMKCPAGTPWTWCLNKSCTVDPSNPKKAICVCDVIRGKEEWMTLGGNCNTSTCETGYWSGATLKDVDEGSAFLIKMLGLEKSPVRWCQNP